MRRCIASRSKTPKVELLRFVLGLEDELLFDVRQRAPGRGVYVRAERKLLEDALARTLFNRGFKTSKIDLPSATELIDNTIIPTLLNIYSEVLSLGRKSGQLLPGAFKVERGLADEGFAALLIASDAAENTRRKFSSQAKHRDLPVHVMFDRIRLGAAIGRSQAVVLGWCRGSQLYQRAALLEKQLKELGWKETSIPTT